MSRPFWMVNVMEMLERLAYYGVRVVIPIYIAQALKVPAISLWGTHAPASRIGYDKNMMDLAIWKQEACQYAPCFAFGGFPVNKCPFGGEQTCCEVLASITPDDVLKKVDMIESASAQVGTFAPAKV